MHRLKKMDIVLQKHKGKRIFNIPDGLDELSADIGREVVTLILIEIKKSIMFKIVTGYKK